MRKIRFELSLSPDRFLAYYNGEIRQVQVTTLSGEIVRFPARALRPFLKHNGVTGLFELTCDEQYRLLDLQLLAG